MALAISGGDLHRKSTEGDLRRAVPDRGARGGHRDALLVRLDIRTIVPIVDGAAPVDLWCETRVLPVGLNGGCQLVREREQGGGARDASGADAPGPAGPRRRNAADTGPLAGADAVADAAVDAGKDRLAEEGRRLAARLRAEVTGDDEPLRRRLLDLAADGVADLSDEFSGQSLSSIMAEVEGFARRNPASFLAGSAVLGFALARLAGAGGGRSGEG